MSKGQDEYRAMVRRAMMKVIPLEVLQLIPETIKAIESLGKKPEDVFKRIIDRAEVELAVSEMTGQERSARIIELLSIAEQRRAAEHASRKG